MAKLDKATAKKEVMDLLDDWADGQDVSFLETDDAGKKVLNAVIDYVASTRMIVQDGKIKIKYEEEWIEFGVPRGAAYVELKDSGPKGIIGFAAAMSKKSPGFFSNSDIRLTKKAMMIASLFMQLP